jgi:hypothetical protein
MATANRSATRWAVVTRCWVPTKHFFNPKSPRSNISPKREHI